MSMDITLIIFWCSSCQVYVENELIQHGKSECLKKKIIKQLHKDWIHSCEQFLASAFMPLQNESLSTVQANPGQTVYIQKKQFTDWNFKFSHQWLLELCSSGMWVCVVLLKHTNIWEETTVSIFGTAVFKVETIYSFKMLIYIYIYAAMWHHTQKNVSWY